MPKIDVDTPEHLKPFSFHGLSISGRGKDGIADCPFCGRAGKLGVNLETTQWRCYGCSVGEEGSNSRHGGGNSLTFVRLLWLRSWEATPTEFLEEIREERGLRTTEGLREWGVARSLITGEVLVPQFSPDGRVHQLCRRVPIVKRERDGTRKIVNQLLPTPGLHPSGDSLGLFSPVGGIVPERQGIMVCEGLWDGVALWEVIAEADPEVAASTSLVAVPGAGVWRDAWSNAVSGKNACLLYDNDHPREGPSGESQAGIDGMKRASGLMLSAQEPPASISYVRWGEEGDGWSKELPDGWDVRDAVRAAGSPTEALEAITGRLRTIPDRWIEEAPGVSTASGSRTVRPLPCESWAELVDAWKRALEWRQGIEDVLAVMLAVALSTEQTGDQVFLQVIGDPSSGKTQFCDAMLTSRHCHLLEHLTGFHSGYKGKKEDKNKKGEVVDTTGKDFSLLARINRKTLITPEGDVIMSQPNVAEIMSQQRRMYDGSSSASFKNSDEDHVYTGLRTPWIMAGTRALLENDQARLGDRFLRVVMDQPTDEQKRNILIRAGITAIREVLVTSSNVPGSHRDPVSSKAYRMTGGYVDHLRNDPARLLGKVDFGDEVKLASEVLVMAQFIADLRCRPHHDSRKDVEPSKEMPARLQKQLLRIAMCLAVVKGTFKIDEDVLRIVRRVAVDTSVGWSMTICSILRKAGEKGEALSRLAMRAGLTEDRLRPWLRFLSHKRIDCVESFESKPSGSGFGSLHRIRWKLTDRMAEAFDAVVGGSDVPATDANLLGD